MGLLVFFFPGVFFFYRFLGHIMDFLGFYHGFSMPVTEMLCFDRFVSFAPSRLHFHSPRRRSSEEERGALSPQKSHGKNKKSCHT